MRCGLVQNRRACGVISDVGHRILFNDVVKKFGNDGAKVIFLYAIGGQDAVNELYPCWPDSAVKQPESCSTPPMAVQDVPDDN